MFTSFQCLVEIRATDSEHYEFACQLRSDRWKITIDLVSLNRVSNATQRIGNLRRVCLRVYKAAIIAESNANRFRRRL
jgi:hypothetical protein